MVDEIEIINKSCLRVDNKEVCNESFKRMNDTIIQGLTDTRKEFNQNLEEYKKKVKEGFKTFEDVSGYKGIVRKEFVKYIREKLGNLTWRALRRETAEERLKEMGVPESEEEMKRKETRKKLMTQEEWERARERAKEF